MEVPGEPWVIYEVHIMAKAVVRKDESAFFQIMILRPLLQAKKKRAAGEKKWRRESLACE